MFQTHPSVVRSTAHAVRAAMPRCGREHEYTLNGSRLRDVLVDGRWITVNVSAPPALHIATWSIQRRRT
ncbi:hypothetical protein [Paraburkholderia acidisoli]|uniref:Uncharacterized protein n=1 Tax=Paraburkholderia acidisoli TaxID=2571748 RepID=A0A7Z2GSZ8_9BURK|nr:hypothetical protein [Paraburkholderia acidisoli]QGZ67039.1 hypothetical protein FAZ98_35000 [Paraburkholderia acidisoli]